jgi:hypothetical protein
MNKKIVLSLVTIATLSSVQAMEFKPVGFKAVGMGGAGVASTRGAHAGYYNPAMLRFSDSTTEISINAGVRVRENNLIDNMDRLSDLEFQDTIDTLSDNAEKGNIFVQSKIVGTDLITADENIDLTTSIYTDNNANVTYEDAISITRGDSGYEPSDFVPGTSNGVTYQDVIDEVNDNNSDVNINTTDSILTITDKDFTVTEDSMNYVQESTLDANQRTSQDKAVDNMNEAIDILTQEIGTKNGFLLSVTPSIAVQASDMFAVGVYSNVDAAFRINIDENYNKLITKQNQNDDDTGEDVYYQLVTDKNDPTYGQYDYTVTIDDPGYEDSSIEYANDNEKNYVQVDSLVFAEVPISYAHLFETKYGSWSVGGSIKPMSLQSYTKTVLLGEDSDDANDNIEDYEVSYDSTIGLDLGFAFRPKNSGATFALVAKNINTPTFKVNEIAQTLKDDGYEAEDYEIKPMVRAGVSYPIWNNNIELALDVDLTKNATSIEDEDSQLIGGGAEFHPSSWFAFRLGAMQDMASEKFDDGTILTTGFGIGLKWLQIDVSGMMSTEKGEFDGNEIPRYVAANVSLVSKWGDGYNRKAAPEAKPRPLNKELTESERNRIKADANKAHQELNKSPF